MFLQALVKYYELLCSDSESSGVAPLGFSPVKVSYEAVLSKEGDLVSLTSLKRNDGKKSVPVEMMLPKSVLKTSGISSNFLYENATYVFGIDKGKPERAKKCFECFKKLHDELLKDCECDEAKAVLAFLSKWEPDNADKNEILGPELSELEKGPNIVFRLDGEHGYVHDNEKIKQIWIQKNNETSEGELMQCLVTGEKSVPTRLHTPIKGLFKGKTTGNQLVSFNSNAYESYGKDNGQGLNAPVSEYAAFAYATALNYLIERSNHNIKISNTTVVFWAEKDLITFEESEEINDIFFSLIEPQEENDENAKEETIADDYTAEKITGYFKEISRGNLPQISEELDSVRFYILGISPNSSRISVNFFMRDTLGNFIKKISKHYIDMQIEKQYPSNREIFSVKMLLKETVSPKSKKDTLPYPTMSNALMRSILDVSPYPYSLYSAVISRIRSGDEIGYYKAAIIKGYLIRLKREKYEEVLIMSLNPDYEETGYLLGRLFAVLEKLQIESSGTELNTTIKDRFFTSACATPANVFPSLLRLSSHHISKAEYGWQYDKKVSEIMEKLEVNKNPFPKTLSIEQQGLFILGYYHQKNALYAKK